MVLAVLNLVVAAVLGYGAAQELIVGGIVDGEKEPFWIGLIGVAICLALALSGVAGLGKWAIARQLTWIAAAGMIAFHIFAALPPHQHVGFLMMLLGAGYGLLLLVVTVRGRSGGSAAAV